MKQLMLVWWLVALGTNRNPTFQDRLLGAIRAIRPESARNSDGEWRIQVRGVTAQELGMRAGELAAAVEELAGTLLLSAAAWTYLLPPD